jgi:hypothetical protein
MPALDRRMTGLRQGPIHMQPSADAGSLTSIATVWVQYGNYVLVALVLLFGWLVLNWLSTISARVDGLTVTVGDLRKDVQAIKDHVGGVLARPAERGD